MFVVNSAWLQVSVFMLLNLLSLIFLVKVRPYCEKSVNYINILNEVISLWVSYFVLTINGLSQDGSDSVAMGDFIVLSIRTSWFLNILIICYYTVRESYQKLR